MKKHLYLILSLLATISLGAQQGYPEPQADANRLFYIQHSNNHNTFVYDANFARPKQLHNTEPIKIYRITYTKGGIKEELSNMQRKLAYGIEFKNKNAAAAEFSLVAYPAKTLQLKVQPDGKPYVMVNINGKDIVLKKMFLSVNKLGTKVTCIDFYGKNTATNKDVCERLVIEKG